MIHRFILHNGRVCDASTPILSPGQLGLLSGWGVFSTLRVASGTLFAFDHHWSRMKRDAELMHVPFPADPAELESDLLKLVEANGKIEATLRVVVVRNRGGLWEGPGNTRDYDVIALTADINSWGESVRLSVIAQARHAESVFAGTKVLSWAQNLTWHEQAHQEGFDEAVLLNEHDEVAECTSANIFAVAGSNVFTPPIGSGCLPGITRNLLLEEVKVEGITVSEKTLRLEDLERADQVFITSTTRGLLPVSVIEGLHIRNDGQVCSHLNAAFNGYIHDYVAARQTSVTQSR